MLSDTNTLAHFPLIAGVTYFVLGAEQLLSLVSREDVSTLDRTSAIALYGGIALYLVGRFAFLRMTSPAQFAAIGRLVALILAAQSLPAAAALGVLAAVLLALVGYKQLATVRP